jgi:hypothetical protein
VTVDSNLLQHSTMPIPLVFPGEAVIALLVFAALLCIVACTALLTLPHGAIDSVLVRSSCTATIRLPIFGPVAPTETVAIRAPNITCFDPLHMMI